ncbi:MAG: TraB/GumN family protein [Lysobacter sp.]|nr:TraB/GumN family protein [Lysobacter sp.]
MRPIRFLPALCAALLVAGLAIAKAPVAPAQPPVPLLWKVSDADNAVYLLGSFHLLRPSDYPLSPDVEAAFKDAKTVVFEIAPDEMDSPALAMQMGQAALRSDGTQLDGELPPTVRTKLAAWVAAHQGALQKSGVPAQALQLFEPWFVGLTVSIVDMADMGLDPKLGLDRHFATEAKAAGKPTAGLETGAQQIAFLAGMDHDEQLQFLAESLDESQGRDDVERLHAAWRRGDAKTLWDGMAADMKRQYPRLYQHVDVDRNDAWVPKIEARLAAPGHDDTLVVVGALHLLGSDGVVEKLRAKGYKVERICSACATR